MFPIQLNIHILGFPIKNWTIFGQFYQIFHFQKSDICKLCRIQPKCAIANIFCKNCFVTHFKIINLSKMKFPFIFNTLKISHITFIQTRSNCAVATKLQLVSYPDKFLFRFYISHVDINNLNLLHQTNFKQKCKFQM